MLHILFYNILKIFSDRGERLRLVYVESARIELGITKGQHTANTNTPMALYLVHLQCQGP